MSLQLLLQHPEFELEQIVDYHAIEIALYNLDQTFSRINDKKRL